MLLFSSRQTAAILRILRSQSRAKKVENAATFGTAYFGISSRPRTDAAVSWSPAPWTIVGEAGPNQQTSNIAPVIEEIVAQPGWTSGSSLAIIFSGSGVRSAVSFDGDPNAAPLLIVEYTIEVPTSLASHGKVHIFANANIEGNVVSLNNNVELDEAVFLDGNIGSGRDVKLKNEAAVTGDVSAAGLVILEGNTVVQGTIIANTAVSPEEPLLSVAFDVTPGSQNITVGENQSLNLAPGQYRDLKVEIGAHLILNSGSYEFKKIEVKDDATVHLDQSEGPIRIDVQEKVKLGKRVQMTSTGSAENILFRVQGGGRGKDIELREGGSFIGTFLGSSAADVELKSDAILIGALFGKKIDVKDRAQLIAAPALDLIFGIATEPPAATITSPLDGSTFSEGASVSFSGIANDFADEALTANLSWESSLDGPIGSGGSFSKTDLSLGVHTVTATVEDSGGMTASDTVTIVVGARSLASITSLGVHDKLHIFKNANISGNAISTNGNVDLDDAVLFDGNIGSGHDIKLKNGANVTGDVTAANRVRLEGSATVQGTIVAKTGVAPDEPVLSLTFDVTPGSQDVTLEENQSLNLIPGSYGQLTVKKSAYLTLNSGHYAFQKIVVEDDATVHLEQSSGPIWIDVADVVIMGKGMHMTSSGSAENILFRVLGAVELLEYGSFLGTFLGSSNSDIKLGHDAVLIGALFGQKIDVKERAQLIGAPALDLIFSKEN